MKTTNYRLQTEIEHLSPSSQKEWFKNYLKDVLESDKPYYQKADYVALSFMELDNKIAYLTNEIKVLGELKKKLTQAKTLGLEITAQTLKALVTQLEPTNAAVVISANHSCMAMRGIETQGTIFPFVFKSKREDDKSQLIAYQRELKYLKYKSGMDTENAKKKLDTVTNKYNLIMKSISSLIGVSVKTKLLQKISAYKSLTKVYFELRKSENEKK